ncbi:glycosyltransferase family 4 protein [Winogradskyella sp.]|uniref:glycosyltransferase family 4 protein n=1 Tax=Winogradskyella sp. TaxID=1883156 RepID=UPI00262AA33A|nr:glycosyltransferase family 4 protein [Winogradskyella sp.]
MKNVLYIGNALSGKGRTKTTIETLGERLEAFCSVMIASKKTNKLLRLLDMMILVIRKRTQTDFVLIDTYSTSNFYYALIISQLCRVFKLKYIPILHGGNLESRLKNNQKMSGLIFNNAYQLITPSRYMEDIFRTYGHTNIEFIPNFIDLENYPFLNRKIEDIKMLWVRSFSNIYNPQLAIHVLKTLTDLGYNASLTMVGPEVDGSLNKAKTLTKAYNLDVNFTGLLERKDWISLSVSHNVFINTTNFDNMPVSIIEAMALGLPIVSTNVGGIPYLISDNIDGILVPANDVEATVKAIVKLKKNESLKDKLVTNARKKAEQFDWKVVKSKWETLLS